MFVRKKKNRSGSTSVVVADKSGGRFRELKTIGISSDEKEIAELYKTGKKWIAAHCGERDMFTEKAREQEKVQKISVEHTRRILDGKIGLVFYDVTTLYFETDSDDELRKRGYSKDGKHAQPQIIPKKGLKKTAIIAIKA